jgi:hypothetical protein
MVDESLFKYFKAQLARGHSVQEVSSFLIQRGYPKEVVNECIQSVYNNNTLNNNSFMNNSSSFNSNNNNSNNNNSNNNISNNNISNNNISNNNNSNNNISNNSNLVNNNNNLNYASSLNNNINSNINSANVQNSNKDSTSSQSYYNDSKKRLNFQNNTQNNNIQNNSRKKVGLVFVGLIFIFIILFVSFYIFYNSIDNSSQEVFFDVEINIDNNFYNNERVTFERTIISDSNLGIPVKVYYNVIDISNKSIFNSEETIYLLDSNTKMIDLKTIEKQGQYKIVLQIEHKDFKKDFIKSFKVNLRQEEINNNLQVKDSNNNDDVVEIIKQCPIFYDDGDKCIRSYCNKDTNYEPVYEPIVPCCGNSVCEEGEEHSCAEDCKEDSDDTYFDKKDIKPNFEILKSDAPLLDQIEEIRRYSKTDLLGAMDLCGTIIFDYFKDECFHKVAVENEREDLCEVIEDKRTVDQCYTKISKTKEDYTLCNNVEAGLRRDSCYMRFGLKGVYDVCPLLEDEYYKQTCEKLREISSNNPEIIEEYSVMIE